MAKVTFILGLCGSGKTHLAMEMFRTTPAILIDEGFNKESAFHDNYDNLIKNLRDGNDAIIIEMEYRGAHNRKVIEQMIKRDLPETEIVWKFFENDVEKANKNLLKRTNKDYADEHMEINSRITKDYEIPIGVKILPIVTDW